jgi:membrane-associated phospholipid phosphatase
MTLWNWLSERIARPPARRQGRQREPQRRRRAPALAVEALEDRCLPAAGVVLEWNQLLLDTARANKTNPLAFTRDLAIESAAVYDAVNAIDRSYTPYFADVKAARGASPEAAAAQAAHDTLAALFPAQQATFDATLAADLSGIPAGRARLGVAVGQAVAEQILASRSTDGSNVPKAYTPGSGPGVWQPTPPGNLAASAPQWGDVTPFGIPGGSAFRAPAPPDLNSPAYTDAFNEVKTLGDLNSTTRTAEQSQIAQFWYGATGTYTAPGYWNQIAQQVAVQRGNSLVENARLFALLNLTEADAAIAVWDTKYVYNFWRPVTAIQAADTDGNDGTAADASWTPYLVTPNHPSYVSGHSGVSSGAATVLAAFFGTDAISFSLSSDSLSGVTRSYTSFSEAAQEASDSRVYAGIHWRFDVVGGATIGTQVGTYITSHLLLPVSRTEDGDSAGEAASVRVGLSPLAIPAAGSTVALAAPVAAQPAGTLPDAVRLAALVGLPPAVGAADSSPGSPPQGGTPAAPGSGVKGAENATDLAQPRSTLPRASGRIHEPFIPAVDSNLLWEALANDLTLDGVV